MAFIEHDVIKGFYLAVENRIDQKYHREVIDGSSTWDKNSTVIRIWKDRIYVMTPFF